MSWERFAHICRVTASKLDEPNSVLDQYDKISESLHPSLYPVGTKKDQLRHLIDTLNTADNKTAGAALAYWGSLNFKDHNLLPTKIRRSIAYLCYLTLFFWMLSGIYLVKVAPVFKETLANFSSQLPHTITYFDQYWLLTVFGVSTLLALTLGFSIEIRTLLKNPFLATPLWLTRLALPKKAKQSLECLQAIVLHPIRNSLDDAGPPWFSSHLVTAENANLNITEELNTLLELHTHQLAQQCDSVLSKATIAVGALIIFAIYFFVSSAYAPLFILGEAI